MKCELCKKEIFWDNSYGLRSFLVCDKCYRTLRSIFDKDEKCLTTLAFINSCGTIRVENEEVKKNDY